MYSVHPTKQMNQAENPQSTTPKFIGTLLSLPTAFGGVVCLLTAVMILVSLLPGWELQDLPKGERYQRPSLQHPMGTDSSGRDILKQLTAASDAYLLPGLLAIGIALSFGVILGCLAGYYTPEGRPAGARETGRLSLLRHLPWKERMHRILDGALSRLDFPIRYGFDLTNALPQLAFIFLICATVSTNFFVIATALGVMGAMKLGGMLRNEIIALRREEYVEAAIELGLSDFTILRRHLLLTRLSPLLISQAFHLFADLVLVETTLRFFFQIIPDAETSWGKLLVNAKNLIFTLHPAIRGVSKEPIHLWWFWFFPALLITMNIIAFYLLADAFSVKRDEEGK
jgi:ABC-type dipeptide/oligopeptide/nickel transport system permease subunit